MLQMLPTSRSPTLSLFQRVLTWFGRYLCLFQRVLTWFAAVCLLYIWATVQKVCREREMRKTSKQSRLFSISIHTPWIETFYCVCEFAEKTVRSIIQSQIVAYSNSSKWFQPFTHPHDMIPVSRTSPPSSPVSAHCFNRFRLKAKAEVL